MSNKNSALKSEKSSTITTTDWETATQFEDISVEELDAALKDYLDSREDYEEKKKISSEANAVFKDKMRKLEQLMERAGKKNWENEVGKAICVDKYQFTTPKDPVRKQEFAKWIEERHGRNAFWDVFGVNSQTLNAFLKQELENDPTLEFPGIEEPTHNRSISFRRSKK